jgi:hypothetical protein
VNQRETTRLFVMILACAPVGVAAQGLAGTASFGPVQTTPCSNCLSTLPPYATILDASAGKNVFPLPGSTRNFASATDFANFMHGSLNAQVTFDGSGNITVALSLLQVGKTYYLDSNNNIRPITDPVSAFVGGLPGQFTIAGVTYHTGIQGQDSLSSSPTSDVRQCNQSAECISGRSYNHHYIANIHDSVGTEVNQETGGYQESPYLCVKWLLFVPYPAICTSSSGSNRLTLGGALFWDPSKLSGGCLGPPNSNFCGGPGPSYTAVARQLPITTYVNTTNVSFSDSTWYFGWPFSAPPPTPASVEIGACGYSSSAAVNSYGATVAASILAQNCWGSGVTCFNGLTLCGGTTCTNLAYDPVNCGACGHYCFSGQTCQSGTCTDPPPPPGCPSGYLDFGDGSCTPPGTLCP